MDPKLRVPTGKTQTLQIFRLTPYGAYVGLPEMDPDYHDGECVFYEQKRYYGG